MTGTTEDTRNRKGRARRSDDERIQQLEAEIARIRAQEEEKRRRDDPLLKEIPTMQRRLRKFAQLAAENDRLDIANSVTAWVSSLDRMVRDDRLRPARLELDDDEVDDSDEG